jgi:HAD superfamily hydrolase (TIGR01549 family)
MFRGHEDILAKLHRLGAKLAVEGKKTTPQPKKTLAELLRGVKAIAIDWDDTIIRFAALNRKAAKELIANIISSNNPTLKDYAYAESKLGDPSKRICKDCIVEEIAQDAAAKGLFNMELLGEMRKRAVDKAFDESLELEGKEGILMPGVEDFLIALRDAGINIYVVSSGKLENKIHQASQLGIKHLFRDFYVDPNKGKEGSITHIAEMEGVEPSQIVMIGDSTSGDMRPARKAGSNFIGFAEDTARENVLKQAGADAVITGSFAELVQAVKNIPPPVSRVSTSGTPSLAWAQDEAATIHNENLRLTPTVHDKTIICHVVTDSILPDMQLKEGILSRLESKMRSPKYGEKIIALSVKDPNNTEEFMAKLSELKKQIETKYEGYKIQFDVACPREDLVEKIQKEGMQALAFKRDGEGEVIQVEGIILALRALRTGSIASLISAYKTITGNDYTTDKTDIKELAQIMLFKLPARKIDVNQLGTINRLIEENIKKAA